MKYNDSTIGQANHIRNNIVSILSTNIAFFEKEVEEGKRANRAILNIVARGMAAFRSIPVDDLDKLSPKRLRILDDAASGFLGHLRAAFDSLNIGDSHTQNRLNEVLHKLTTWESDYYDTVLDVSSVLRVHASSGDQWQNQLSAEITSFQSDVATKREEAQRLIARIETLLHEAADSVSKQKVSDQAAHFATESEKHKTEAEKWLGKSRVLLITVLVSAFAALYASEILIERPSTLYEWVQLGLSKAVILSVLVYAFLNSVRNYKANIHNAVVNKHRANALLTYNALAESARDADKRDIILTKAAECIFSPQATGFSKTEGSDNDTINVISVPPNAAKAIASSSQG